jgi:hypothetical protein
MLHLKARNSAYMKRLTKKYTKYSEIKNNALKTLFRDVDEKRIDKYHVIAIYYFYVSIKVFIFTKVLSGQKVLFLSHKLYYVK